jgi:hypothetical protein
MKRYLLAVLVCSISVYSTASFATSPAPSCKNQASLQRITSSAFSKIERNLSALEKRFDSLQNSIENRRLGLENRRAGIDSAVALQESRMATCDVAAGILTQIFNDRNVTRATCTSNAVVGQIVGTVVDVFKCKVQCAILSQPDCEQRCEQRISADARRCSRLAQQSCVRAVSLRVRSDEFTKQLRSATFNSTCTDGSMQGCPNGQLRSLYVKILKGRTERDAAKAKADAADAALAACLGGA